MEHYEISKQQTKHFETISAILKDKFGIFISKFDEEETPEHEQSQITSKFILEGFDPIALNCLYQMALKTKSSAISLCVLCDHLPIEEAVKITKSHFVGIFNYEQFGDSKLF